MLYLGIEVAKYDCSLLRILKVPNSTISWFNNRIQMTMPLGMYIPYLMTSVKSLFAVYI